MNQSSPLLLMNIFAARCFLDLFDNENCLDRIRTFAQKQLGKMHVPFIEHLTITDLNLGDRLPQIQVGRRWMSRVKYIVADMNVGHVQALD